jgi:hypothetical protein
MTRESVSGASVNVSTSGGYNSSGACDRRGWDVHLHDGQDQPQRRQHHLDGDQRHGSQPDRMTRL